LSEAQAAYETGQFAGVGLVLTAEMSIVGFDLDHCIEEGLASDEARRIISALDSYAETSPSGTGVRILLEGKLPGAFARNPFWQSIVRWPRFTPLNAQISIKV
jgi:primase-polymerase (primpol)-like protein